MTDSEVPPRVAGLILAGGEGKRFGGPKAFAELGDGRTFLEACAATLIGAGAEPVVATLPPGTEDPGLDAVDTLPLPESGLDMFGSLRVGLSHLIAHPGWTTVAILPVDHPLVRSDTVAVLSGANRQAAVPSFNGKHGHPICIDRGVAEAIAAEELGGPTLREVLRSVGAVDVEVDDPGVVANCNTPEALRKALGRLSS
jgi:CTP:molybdopterin cytidylyltransferase MocA